LGQCNDRLADFGQGFTDFLFKRRLARSGATANNHYPIA
jgi:hypothetical protein